MLSCHKTTKGKDHTTGVPTIQKKLAKGGSPHATFETTDDRLTFLINIPVHPGCDNKLLQLDAPGQVSIPEGTFVNGIILKSCEFYGCDNLEKLYICILDNLEIMVLLL